MQAFLLVDDESRVHLDFDITELKKVEIEIISDLKELLKLEYKEEPIILLDSFVASRTGISELILFRELLGFQYIFISSNKILLKQMARYSKTFSFDTVKISCSMLLAALHDDPEACECFHVEAEDRFQKIASIILDNPGIVDETAKEMAKSLLCLSVYNKTLYSQVVTLEERLSTAEKLDQSKNSQLKHLSSIVDSMLRQTVQVNDALEQYSFLCQKDVYKKVSIAKYKNKPKILYFKEYGEFLHLESFLHTLAETLKRQYDCPTKVLWVMDKNNPLRQKYIPSYYTIFSEGVFHKPVVHMSDYMCTTGGYEEIINVLCENQSSIGCLVVVDSKLIDDTILPVSDLVRFDLCRSISKINAYGLYDLRTIVNNEADRDLAWNHYTNLKRLNEEEQFLFLSNRTVISKCINILLADFEN